MSKSFLYCPYLRLDFLHFMVEVTGIEPATSWSQTTRAPICATPRSVVYLKGFEPLTHGLEGRCSIQLS